MSGAQQSMILKLNYGKQERKRQKWEGKEIDTGNKQKDLYQLDNILWSNKRAQDTNKVKGINRRVEHIWVGRMHL